MALKKHTVADLLELISAIEEAAKNVRFAVDGMLADEMPLLWTNSTDAAKRLIPDVRKWARKVRADFETELDAFKAGRASPAEMNQLRGLVNKQRKSKDRESMPKSFEPIAEISAKKPAKKSVKKRGKS